MQRNKSGKLMGRREFAKLAGGAALVAPLGSGLAPGWAWSQDPKPAPPRVPESPPAQQAEIPKPEPKLKLTPEQEEAVKKAVERRERQLAAMRSRALPYDAEPAFVFQVRQRPHNGRKP
jgi:hypothetical protein